MPDARPVRFGCRFGEAAVDVETDGDELAAFVSECLAPGIRVQGFGGGEVTITISRRDDGRYENLRARVGSASRPFFALDRKTVALPAAREGTVLIVADDRHDCVYRLDRGVIDVVGRAGAPRVATGLMRVVREWLTASRLRREALVDLHAAALEWNGHGVLLSGPKYSGKTTALCHAATSAAARIIANDRVLLQPAGPAPTIFGVPTLVAVRPHTAVLFPQLSIGDASPAFRSAQTQTLRSLARRLGAPAVESARLRSVLFVRVSDRVTSWSLEPMGLAEALEESRTAVFGASHALREPTVFEALQGATADRRVAGGWISGDLRVYRCLLGPRAYEHSAAGWLRQACGA